MNRYFRYGVVGASLGSGLIDYAVTQNLVHASGAGLQVAGMLFVVYGLFTSILGEGSIRLIDDEVKLNHHENRLEQLEGDESDE